MDKSVAIHEAARRGLLKGEKKAAYDEAVRRGLLSAPAPDAGVRESGDEAMRQVARDLPQNGAIAGGGLGVAGMMIDPTLRVGMGSAFNDLGENITKAGQYVGEKIGVLGPNDRARMEAEQSVDDQGFRALDAERPYSTMVGRGLGQAAMFAGLPGAQGSLAARTAVSAAEGALTGVATTSETESPWTNFYIGGGLGMLAPLAAKAVGHVVNKMSTKPIQVTVDGRFTDEAIDVLERAKARPEDFADEVVAELRKSGLTKEQLQNFNAFRDLGLDPTRAQVTGLKSDFMVQQELAKTSNAVTTRLAEQDKILGDHVDALISGTGAKASDNIDAGNMVSRAIFGRVNEVDEAISAAYQAARASAPKAKTVSLTRTAAALRRMQSQDKASNGLVSAIQGDLQQRGLVEGFSAQGRRGSVELAEEARKFINQVASENPQARARLAKELKEALDADVMAAVGEDVFKDARAVKARFERSMERVRTTRRDAGARTLVESLVENRANPDTLVEQIVRKSTRSGDVAQLKRFLESGTPEQVQAGREALAELKAATLRDVYKKATSGTGLNEGGAPVFSGQKFKQALDSIGNAKLSVLFDADELTMIGKISRVGELRIPPQFTALGGGPSARGALAAAGADVMDLVTPSDPQTNVLLRLTGGLFRRVKQSRLERTVLSPEQHLRKSTPSRAPKYDVPDQM